MFYTQEDYIEATKEAQLYAVEKESSNNNKLIIFNILFFIILLFISINYFISKHTASSAPKQRVLGVSETIDDSELSNARLMKILSNTEVDLIKEDDTKYTQGDLANSMNLLIRESAIKSTSSYTEELAQELDDRSGFRGKISVANKSE